MGVNLALRVNPEGSVFKKCLEKGSDSFSLDIFLMETPLLQDTGKCMPEQECLLMSLLNFSEIGVSRTTGFSNE
jgi:hypothetical protein